MTASESSPLTANLQESIQHLITETVRRSQVDHEKETDQLRTALQQALTEVEASQAAMSRAAELLRTALDAQASDSTLPISADDVEITPPTPVEESATAPAPIDENAPGMGSSPEDAKIGPHDLDVIAHNIYFKIAGSLQRWLKERPEVKDARTRTYVDNELHLELKMESGLDMAAMNEWMAENDGQIATNTASVLELRFGN